MSRAIVTLVFFGSFLGAGCGGSTPQVAHAESTVTLEPAAFLQRVGAEASVVLREPERSVDELDEARQGARGSERRQALRDLAVALMYLSFEAERRPARRHRERAERMLTAAARGNRDATLGAEVDFVRLWMAWRSELRPAPRLAERFTRRHESAGTLTTVAWMIRGEIAFAAEDYEEAASAYRFALGQLGTPLYAFALYRTAHTHRERGETEEAAQALDEVIRMGCEEGAHEEIMRVSTAAASESGSGLRLDADGVTRPAVCPTPGEESEEATEEEGWRPAE